MSHIHKHCSRSTGLLSARAEMSSGKSDRVGPHSNFDFQETSRLRSCNIHRAFGAKSKGEINFFMRYAALALVVVLILVSGVAQAKEPENQDPQFCWDKDWGWVVCPIGGGSGSECWTPSCGVSSQNDQGYWDCEYIEGVNGSCECSNGPNGTCHTTA